MKSIQKSLSSELEEIWKLLPNYENEYEVSSLGRVRSITRKTLGRWNKLKTNNGRVLKSSQIKNGYLRVDLSKNGKSSHQLIHRLIALAFIPNEQDKPCVNHKDRNRTNNEVLNLEWVSYSENTQHAIKNGSSMRPKYLDARQQISKEEV